MLYVIDDQCLLSEYLCSKSFAISILCLPFLGVLYVVPRVSGNLTDSNPAKKENSCVSTFAAEILRLLLNCINYQVQPLTNQSQEGKCSTLYGLGFDHVF